MRVIGGIEATQIRERYVKSFINCDLTYYKQLIKTKKTYVDGSCYIGYLWDCIINASNIPEQRAHMIIGNHSMKLYVMWDIHTCEHIFIEDYWKYPKEAILEISLSEFEDRFNSFPEDIYVFDSSFQWTVSFTHEYDENGRICRYTCFQ